MIENAGTLNRQGEDLFNKGDLDGALTAFRKAASLDDRIAVVHNNLGVVHWFQGRPKEALQEFTKVFEIDPQNRSAAMNCGEIFQGLGRTNEAEAIYRSYLQTHPDDEEVRSRLDRSGPGRPPAERNPAPPSVTGMIHEGDLVFDVGANIGSKTAKYLERGARVVLFEPQPDCVEALRKRFGSDPRLTIVPKGLGRNSGRKPLSLCRGQNVLSTFSERWKTGRFKDQRWDGSVMVDMMTLDEAVDLYGLPKYCKIDVEGYESEVLRGLSRPIPLLSFEFTREFLDQAGECMAILEGMGYREFNLSLAEGEQLLLDPWVGSEQLLDHLSRTDAPLLWGDIHARSASSACGNGLGSGSASARAHPPATPAPGDDSRATGSTGEHELLSFLFQSEMVPRGGVVFDVGANVGDWTKQLLDIDPGFRVHLFEPVASTYGALMQNMAQRMRDCSLTPNNLALAGAEGTRTIHFYRETPSWSTFFRRRGVERDYQVPPPKEQTIQATTLDLYCGRMGIHHIHFLKLDVEGAELEVLQGGRGLLTRNRIDFIQFEYGGTFSDSGTTLQEVFSLLQGHRYMIFKLSSQKMDCLPSFSPSMEDYRYANFLAANERFRSLLFKIPPKMLDLKKLFRKKGVSPRGVIHVGAHEGDESRHYLGLGASKVLMIEANPSVFGRMARNTSDLQNVIAVNCAVTDHCGTASLHITSMDQSSSILPLKRHKEIYPEIRETDQVTVRAMTLDALLEDLMLAPEEFNFLNMDIQGAELMALRGGSNLLRHLDAINLEVNFEELYEGGALVGEIDDFLEKGGFERVATTTPYHPSWGDGFYCRKPGALRLQTRPKRRGRCLRGDSKGCAGGTMRE